MVGPVDRRALLAGAAGLALSGCGRSATQDAPGGAPPERETTSRRGDVELLQVAYAEELASSALYASLARSARGDERALYERFGRYEDAHAAALQEVLRERRASGEARPVRRDLDDAQIAEGTAIAFYLDVLPKLYDAKLRSLVGSILAVEAEQLAVLRARGGLRPATDPFVYGFRA